MTKKTKSTTGTTTPKTRKPRAAKTQREMLINKVQKVNYTLGTLLTPRYNSAGDAFNDRIKIAQEAVVAAGQLAYALPDDWSPAVKRLRKMTPERLQELKNKAEKLAARIREAEAAQ